MSGHFPQPNDQTCYLILVRHGATDNNLANPPVLQGGKMNPPLSKEGERQAKCLHKLLESEKIAAFYSSPQHRARQTAAIAAGCSIEEIPTFDALVECDLGDWEGRSWLEIQETEPEAYRQFMDDPGIYPYAGGESFGDVQKRAAPVIRELVSKHLGETIVIVAHNIVNRAMHAEAMDFPLKYVRRIHLDNCGFSLFRFRDETFRQITINSTMHLGT
ncbi:Alpha-ribazole phosphatase [Planctomycetales bacterium 10988]|nr:Alpha-ribazole phosphatase [Planctomycetales bacterium 10988]